MVMCMGYGCLLAVCTICEQSQSLDQPCHHPTALGVWRDRLTDVRASLYVLTSVTGSLTSALDIAIGSLLARQELWNLREVND